MSGLVKGLFGGKSSAEGVLEKFRPVDFNSPGLEGRFNAGTNRFDLTRTGEGNNAIAGLVKGFQDRSQAFSGLADRVKPGFGELTRTTVDAIRSAGSRTVGNLREELSRRRVLGSTFGQREITSVEADFAQREKLARAEAKVAELDQYGEFLGEATKSAVEGALAVLNQFNFESSLAAGMATKTGDQLNANITARAEARAAQEEGAGGFLGTVIGAVVGGPIGAGIGKKIFG